MLVKKLLISFSLALVGLSATADVLSPAQAMERYNSLAAGQQMRVRGQMLKGEPVLTIQTPDHQPGCYVWNRGDGFVILSADDQVAPVLGYSDYRLDSDIMPDGLTYWLETYAEQIAQARANSVAYQATDRCYAPIAPMLTTKWNQDSPYNKDCPKVNRKTCPTGCTATAMAQVLRYHQWPVTGVGQHSYSFQGTTYSYDYENAHFDYSLMLDSYTSGGTADQKSAVANLMFACGVAADMQYGVNASGAYLSNALNGLIRNLRYSKEAKLGNRDQYSVKEWEETLYSSLATTGPVIFCGYTQGYDGAMAEGHTFVIDGYSTDGYFHINWGWGGVGDGYFLLNALDTNGNGSDVSMEAYGNSQQAIFNLRPLAEGEVEEPTIQISMSGQFNLEGAATELGQTVSWTANYTNSSDIDLEGVSFGLGLYGETGESLYLYDATTYDMAKGQRMNSCTVTVELPDEIAAGEYQVGIVFTCSYDSKVHHIALPGMDRWYMEVSDDGSVEFYREQPGPGPEPETRTPIVSTPKLYSAICNNQLFSAFFTVTAPEDAEYSGSLAALLLTDADDAKSVIASAQHVTVNLLPGETIGVDYTGTFRNIEDGEYFLAIGQMTRRGGWGQPSEYSIVSKPIEVEVAAPSTDAFKLEISDIRFSAKKENLEEEGGKIIVTFLATCVSGYKSTEFYMDFYRSSDNTALGSVFTPEMTFSAGFDREVTITTELSSIEPGVKYFARLMTYDTTYTTLRSRIDFTIDAIQTGIAETLSEDTVVGREVYNLMGVKVTNDSLGSGIYIEVLRHSDGKTTTRKIIR